jgi:hypothetical protein
MKPACCHGATGNSSKYDPTGPPGQEHCHYDNETSGIKKCLAFATKVKELELTPSCYMTKEGAPQ